MRAWQGRLGDSLPRNSSSQDNTIDALDDLDWLLNNQDLDFDYGTLVPLVPASESATQPPETESISSQDVS